MWEDDDDKFVSDKFDDCYMCVHKFCERTCDNCDMGEEFEEIDPDNLEDMLV